MYFNRKGVFWCSFDVTKKMTRTTAMMNVMMNKKKSHDDDKKSNGDNNMIKRMIRIMKVMMIMGTSEWIECNHNFL